MTVTSLVGPDGDVHAYAPAPRDSEILSNADLVVENGLSLDSGFARLGAAAGFKGPVIIASSGVTPRFLRDKDPSLPDPHAWQDVSNARLYVKNIAKALSDARPDEALFFQKRAATYDAELARLDAWVRTEINAVPLAQRKIITSHDSFGYFGAAYGVTFLAPQGLSPEIPPTATQIATLIDQIKAQKISRIFFENKTNAQLATQLAKDTKASLGSPLYADSLSQADGPAATYISLFHYNVTRFKEAMLLNGK